jgi:hypothetical protein
LYPDTYFMISLSLFTHSCGLLSKFLPNCRWWLPSVCFDSIYLISLIGTCSKLLKEHAEWFDGETVRLLFGRCFVRISETLFLGFIAISVSIFITHQNPWLRTFHNRLSISFGCRTRISIIVLKWPCYQPGVTGRGDVFIACYFTDWAAVSLPRLISIWNAGTA